MTQSEDTSSASVSLEALVSRAERAGRSAPPVEQWNPPHCGTIDMAIDEDGRWLYQGSPIDRPALARLFSSVLRREVDGSFVLVTPAEKLTIRVADVPFVAVEMSDEAGRLRFRTNMGDVVEADDAHPLRFAEAAGDAFRPYLRVRGGLEARLTRALAFDLAQRIEERGGEAGIASGSSWFPVPLAPSALDA
ncbi:DUF1285 domain-containing protein [Aureimonas phyllosphaerae]|uniref:DUF1285 domain-containing protein n=1 Tax=Aureimonas phyllosphaerae TaxID=1166078 RepID=A0A7W6FU38_9HYPH|nr:DUF1285 domain-containing protein [Aureimonas phyllosphaerae]MBB3935819.1 hypothetical protein [Aureimonas phyllosphaerae]MBB3959827.1 hypothetical protein [Aureimonas phyllosphaerae]SFF15487.1 hypothetical protein SAMN05216566_103359 [Aureimonas phyllosphaerae]